MMAILVSGYSAYTVMILFMMVLSFFFSGSEMALISSNVIHLEQLGRKGDRRARRALFLLERVDETIGMMLIGLNIVNIASSAFITFIATRAFLAGEMDLFIVTAVESVVFLVFCEVAPKVIARAHAEGFLMFVSYPVMVLMTVLRPAVKVSLLFSKMIKKLFGADEAAHGLVRSRDELNVLFRIGEEEGVIGREHKSYVSEILSFKDMGAREIMTPTVDIISVELRHGVRELVELFVKTKFTRIPVYDTRVDNIVGYVFYRDLLGKPVRRIAEAMSKVHYVPSTKKIVDLYSEMVENLIPLVVVVNEHGGVVGMVTHEDIAEEVVGEINPRDQAEETLIEDLGRKRYLLSGKLDIEYFSSRFRVPIDKKGFETLAGFILYRMGKIPRKGDRLDHDRYTLVIEEATERSIDRVILQPRKMRREDVSGTA